MRVDHAAATTTSVVADGRRRDRARAARRGRRAAGARARDRVRPRAARRPRRRSTAARSAGPETKTLVVYDEPFWRADGFSGQTAEPGSAVRGHDRRVAGRRALRRARRRSRSATWPRRSTASPPASAARRVLDALAARLGPEGGVARRVRRDGVVARGVDPRLLDGALPARHPHAATATCSASRWAASTGPAPRRRRPRTAPSTAPSAPASAPRPRSSTPDGLRQSRRLNSRYSVSPGG